MSPFRPLPIRDLYWNGRYFPGGLFWSRDGTVAAASIIDSSSKQQIFACAYDFREHRAIQSGSFGNQFDGFKEREIQLLLESRGGYDRVSLPDYKEL